MSLTFASRRLRRSGRDSPTAAYAQDPGAGRGRLGPDRGRWPAAVAGRDRLRSPSSVSNTSTGPAVAHNPAPAPAANDPAATDNDLSEIDGLLGDVDSDLASADAPPADAD